NGMAEHAGHVAMGMLPGPENTLPMMAGEGQFGPLEMGGMFTVVKVRNDMKVGDYRDPGWYAYPPDKIARRISNDPNFGSPQRQNPYGTMHDPAPTTIPLPGTGHAGHGE
ncbi:MAG: copper oxidase, partial [Pseudomonadota bacterium]